MITQKPATARRRYIGRASRCSLHVLGSRTAFTSIHGLKKMDERDRHGSRSVSRSVSYCPPMTQESRDSTPQLLNVRETLEQLRISRTSLYRLIANGDLRSVRLNRRVLFDSKDVLFLIERRKS